MEVLMSCHQKYCSKSNKRRKCLEAFNMITNKNKAKAMKKHISCDCKCKFGSATSSSNQKWNNKMENVNVNLRIIVSAKMIIFGILAHVFVRIAGIYKVLVILQ